MDVDKRLELIKRNTEEILTEGDLNKLLENGERIKHYIGFEISGKVHLGTGLASMLKVRDFIEAGVDCSIFLADWHSWINDKLGGNPEIIKRVAVGYFKEALKSSLKCVGCNNKEISKIKFVLGSELYHNNDLYWTTFIDICKNTNLARILRSITILGRKEGESVDFAKLIYPPMQVADIFIQDVNLAHAGLDQRKAHVIARDIANKLSFKFLVDSKGNKIKPISIHHHLILGLGKPSKWPISREEVEEVLIDMKMSKSKPDTCIFIHDSPEEIKRKVNMAFCMEKEISYNPILDWCNHLIFPISNKLQIKRDKKFGGNVSYNNYGSLEKDFKEGKLHPMDLKNAVENSLIKILEPARKHFSAGKPKKYLEELEKLIK
ncbi:MAG: tyrosine--tRNA ligase [Nanoarchaeota archaeon]